MSVLRELRWQDIPAVSEIERRAFPGDAWSEPTFWAELAARPRRAYRVLEHAGRVMAYGGLDLTSGDAADVMTVAVAPEHRGEGLGGLLLRELLAVADAHGCGHVLLEVRADNRAAVALYERHGFAQLHVRRRYYRDGADALVMRAEVGRGRAAGAGAGDQL